MTYDPNDTPAAQFERYIASVEERPRYQPKPGRWWHFAPVVLALVATVVAWGWNMGRMLKAW